MALTLRRQNKQKENFCVTKDRSLISTHNFYDVFLFIHTLPTNVMTPL